MRFTDENGGEWETTCAGIDGKLIIRKREPEKVDRLAELKEWIRTPYIQLSGRPVEYEREIVLAEAIFTAATEQAREDYTKCFGHQMEIIEKLEARIDETEKHIRYFEAQRDVVTGLVYRVAELERIQKRST